MKNSNILRIVFAALSVVVLTAGVLATSTSKTADIFFRDIKIMIDGAEYVAKDANGNIVEPFIMDGTTYLPVRAVANAFDKDVKWDGKTATVYIGKEGRMAPDNRLDKVQYTNYWEGDSSNYMEIINGTVTDYNGDSYTNGLIFYIDRAGLSGETRESTVTYPLNGQYDALTGKVVLPKSISTTTRNGSKLRTSETARTITDENGDVLYKANGITASMPFSFDIDVSGVNKIIIKLSTQGQECYVALTDLALYE